MPILLQFQNRAAGKVQNERLRSAKPDEALKGCPAHGTPFLLQEAQKLLQKVKGGVRWTTAQDDVA
jgi:hypothetical protein